LSSASGLLRTAVRDAEAKGSVHEIEVIRSTAGVNTYRDDVSRTSGLQKSTSSTGISTDVLVVNGSAFFDGNQPALRFLYELSATAAKEIGTGWVSVPKSTALYLVVVGDVTLPSALEQVSPVGPLTETGPTVVDGIRVVGIHGKTPANAGGGTETLYVSRSGQPLPVVAIYASANSSTRATFTRWSEHLTVRAPARSVSITKFAK